MKENKPNNNCPSDCYIVGGMCVNKINKKKMSMSLKEEKEWATALENAHNNGWL